jgi:hypothetical protein
MRYASLRPLLDPLLPLVEKPGRYVGLERNVTRKDLSQATVTLALAFPDTYEIGMSHTGLKILYEIVNRREDFACERVYAPWTDLEARMRRRHPLFSTESFAPVADFDVLGFSLQAELNYSNILNMLDLAGFRSGSSGAATGSVVLGGGPAPRIPSRSPDFFDAFLSATPRRRCRCFWTPTERRRPSGPLARDLLSRSRRSTASTCRRSTTSHTGRRRDRSDRAQRPRARRSAPPPGSRSASPTTTPTSPWSRPSRSSRTGWAWRSCAAARRAAASARPATGTGPCASSIRPTWPT